MLDGLLTIDDRGTVLSMNPAGEAILGYAASEVIGNNVSMLMDEPDRARHDDYIRRYLKTGVGRIIGVGQRRLEALTKDGRRIPIDLGISEMALGGRRTFIGTIRDMTNAVEADARLRASEERHRLVAEAMTDTV
jgi:PAS domain S-box-containing protein